MSNVYRVLLLAHLLCVIGGFGTLAYNGLFLSLARRRGAAGMTALDINGQVSALAELLVYGTFLFGVAAVATSSSTWTFSQGWVSAAFALFIVDVGVLHGLIRPTQRRYLALADRVAAASVAAGPDAPRPDGPEAAQMVALEKRISLGWGLFNVIVIAVVVLMVFRPGA